MSKIILIDDEESLRRMLTQMLSLDGHTVLEAENGKKALPLCKAPDIDLVITDIVMPEMEGFETIQTIRKLHPAVKIVAMSGGGHVTAESYLEIARKLGADESLVKPFTHSELRKAVTSALHGQGSTESVRPKGSMP